MKYLYLVGYSLGLIRNADQNQVITETKSKNKSKTNIKTNTETKTNTKAKTETKIKTKAHLFSSARTISMRTK